MDSTCSKDSNGILFVFFWVTDQKLWIIKLWTKFRFKFLFWTYFESEQATWPFLTGAYWFGWIKVRGRRILRWSDAQDFTVPIRLSDLIWTTWSWSDGRGRGGVAHRLGLGFQVAGVLLRCGLRLCFELWRNSGRFLGQGSGRRRAGDFGELEFKVGVTDCFL
jgi:hypothetical protein